MMSKGLEELKEIELKWQYGVFTFIPNFEIIEKELKALEIIKEKKVNLEYLKCCENYEQYKTICSYWSEITSKEFDLLKEVLL